MLNRMRKFTEEREQGFTLIELLVVIIIIGILAAIAIPVFLNQRKKGVDASLKSDLKNAASSVETYITDNPSSTGAMTLATITAAGYDFKASPNNTITVSGTPSAGYCITGTNAGSTGGSAKFFFYDSGAGGLLPGGMAATAPAGKVNC